MNWNLKLLNHFVAKFHHSKNLSISNLKILYNILHQTFQPEILFYLHSGKKSESNPHILKDDFRNLQTRYKDYKQVNTDGAKEDLKVGCAIKWASAWDFQQCGMCDQQSLRSTCAYAQSDQSLCSPLEYSMSVKLLTEHLLEVLSSKEGYTGSYESTLVKMPHCWKSHATAQIRQSLQYATYFR